MTFDHLALSRIDRIFEDRLVHLWIDNLYISNIYIYVCFITRRSLVLYEYKLLYNMVISNFYRFYSGSLHIEHNNPG